ncbi:MAG: hypothetical protein LBC88_02435 [Spirochaetaceae bacterium]|jgi:hypothetical protein|nr:hypothetical protein [Spirochaetaceae bacterium]
MIDWIKKTIHPPGIQKKNRLSLFSAIGEIANRVRADALRAFNAHFPYLADEKKLEEHGNALLIPRLIDDTPKEYRDRVTAASFFLMRAGERAYIIGQLRAHFGDRYVVSEDFLRLYVKILEINDSDRAWVFDFLDSLLDPNISLTVADWFRFVEQILITEHHDISVKKRLLDFYPYRGTLRYDGRFLCDQGEEMLCNGAWLCDGSAKCVRFRNAVGTLTGVICQPVFCDGYFICDGATGCSGYEITPDGETPPLPIVPSDVSSDRCETFIFVEPMADTETITDSASLTIKQLSRCNGSWTPSCSLCDGGIVCDGSYTGFDGRYCREDILREVV